MDALTIVGIAVGLAMDAFAVALGTGLALGSVSGRQTFRMAFHFGLFQFIMSIVGWTAGTTVERWIAPFDHFIAFGLLAWIGGRMIISGIRGGEKDRHQDDPTRGWSLVMLSFATSMDSLAVGLSFGILDSPILVPSIVIGMVCAVLTTVGLHLGRFWGELFGEKVEAVGGVILIAIGVKILVEHMLG